jgi:hypothetical protein
MVEDEDALPPSSNRVGIAAELLCRRIGRTRPDAGDPRRRGPAEAARVYRSNDIRVDWKSTDTGQPRQ